MAKLSDVIGYLCERYPHPHDLSKARLTKMVYLADWRSSLQDRRQISDIKWIFNHYGPYVDDVINAAKRDDGFVVVVEQNAFGDMKERIVLKHSRPWDSLSERDKVALDHVIQQTKSLHWQDFIKLVYSTFPVVVSARQSYLDLPKLADRYQSEVRLAVAS